MKSNGAVWLAKGEGRVLVDVGSRAEAHWRAQGYAEEEVVVAADPIPVPVQPAAPALKKTRRKRSEAEAVLES